VIFWVICRVVFWVMFWAMAPPKANLRRRQSRVGDFVSKTMVQAKLRHCTTGAELFHSGQANGDQHALFRILHP
jgi:hypothetical protein